MDEPNLTYEALRAARLQIPPIKTFVLGLGTLPADWLDLPMLATALHKVSRSAAFGECSLRYGEPAGDMRLRRALSHKLAEYGVKATAPQILTTIGEIGRAHV